jgi:hypothetical protein
MAEPSIGDSKGAKPVSLIPLRDQGRLEVRLPADVVSIDRHGLI